MPELLPIAGIGIVVTVLLSMRPFAGSELRYVAAGRAMLRGGDWVVPHLAGVPYMEKPILFYWMSAGAQAALGLSNVAARVPSICGSVAMLVVAYAFAFEFRGRAFARATAGLLAGSLGFLAMSTSLTTDPLFSGALAVAWYALWRHLRDDQSRWKWVFWLAAAAAMLAKGPLGPVLLGATCILVAVAERRVAPLMRLRPFSGGLLFAAVCAPWHVAVWLRDPRLLEFFYVRQNLRAAIDGHVNHEGPVWYYAPVLLGLLFPFSVLVVTALVAAVRRLLAAQPHVACVRVRLHVFLAAAWIGPLVVLTLAASKLGTYALPLLPLVAVLVAREAVVSLRNPGRLLRIATIAPAVVLTVAAVVGIPRVMARYDLERFRPEYAPMVGAAVLALFVGVGVGAWLGWRGRVSAYVFMGAGVVIALALAIPVAIDPGARFDAREAARHVESLRTPEDVLIAAGGDVTDYSIQIELGERVAILGRARELGMGHWVETRKPPDPIPADPYGVDAAALPEDPWLLDSADLRALWKGHRRVWLFGDADDVAALRRRRRTAVYTIFDDGKHSVFSNRERGVHPHAR